MPWRELANQRINESANQKHRHSLIRNPSSNTSNAPTYSSCPSTTIASGIATITSSPTCCAIVSAAPAAGMPMPATPTRRCDTRWPSPIRPWPPTWRNNICYMLPVIGSSRLVTYLGWMQNIPETVIFDRAYLCAGCGWAYVLTNQPEAARRYVDAGDLALSHYEPVTSAPDSRLIAAAEVAGNLMAIRAYAARARGDRVEAAGYSEQALATLPPAADAIRCAVAHNLGMLRLDEGELDPARQAFYEAVEAAKRAHKPLCGDYDAEPIGRHCGHAGEAQGSGEPVSARASFRCRRSGDGNPWTSRRGCSRLVDVAGLPTQCDRRRAGAPRSCPGGCRTDGHAHDDGSRLRLSSVAGPASGRTGRSRWMVRAGRRFTAGTRDRRPRPGGVDSFSRATLSTAG